MEHRIGDRRIVRLIRKWLRAGILEDGAVAVRDRGTGQGAVISPLLANIYLHYVLDLWAERWRRREATGDMIIVRGAVLGPRAARTRGPMTWWPAFRARGRRPSVPRGDAGAV